MRPAKTWLGVARLFTLAAIILIGQAPTETALAHASLISSQPEDGAVLPESPERFILIFNEPVAPLRLQLIDALGKATPLTNIVQHDATVIVRPPGTLDQGTHVLSWRVVSSDGHPVGGTVVFSVGQPNATTPIREARSDPLLNTGIWLVRIVIFIALFFGLGGAVFAHWIAARSLPARTERLLGALCAAGPLAVLLSVGLQGLDALELPLPALGQANVWQTGFSTSYGSSALFAFLALAAAWLSLLLRSGARMLALAALLAAGFALAASGHAAAAAPQWLTRPSVWLHAVAIALWIGSLWPLAVLLRGDATSAQAALRRFTLIIPFVLVALLASGTILAVIQLARVQALWTTNYGLILSIKLAAVSGLLALAAANRFWLTRKAEAGDIAERLRLRRSIVAEIGLALLIFALAAGWRFTPPPRSVVAEQSEFIHFHSGSVMADITLVPGRVGRSAAEIMIRDGDYQPMAPKGVTLVLAHPASGIEPLRREAVSIGDNRWRIDDVLLPSAGRWRLRVDVLIDDFQKISVEDDILVRP